MTPSPRPLHGAIRRPYTRHNRNGYRAITSEKTKACLRRPLKSWCGNRHPITPCETMYQAASLQRILIVTVKVTVAACWLAFNRHPAPTLPLSAQCRCHCPNMVGAHHFMHHVQNASHLPTFATAVDQLRQQNCPRPATKLPTVANKLHIAGIERDDHITRRTCQARKWRGPAIFCRSRTAASERPINSRWPDSGAELRNDNAFSSNREKSSQELAGRVRQ